MNVADKVMRAITSENEGRFKQAVNMGVASYTYCNHHCGNKQFHWYCFTNSISLFWEYLWKKQ